jgi:RimJ/RimL family protein N-acetyltransferase
MSALMTLSGGRVCLRRWRDEDREAFAAVNSDARVMEFFARLLTRVESDAMVDRIEKHFSEHGFGLWAIEVPGVAPFIGFAGLTWARFSAPFTPCVEAGWRLAFEHWGHGYATEAARLALGYGFGALALRKSYLSHRRRTSARGQSWNGSGCAAILRRISTILRFRKAIRCEGTCCTGAVRIHNSP